MKFGWRGALGVLLSAAGLAAALTTDLGPVWYPAALLLITMPCALLGGWIHSRGAR